MEGDFEKITTDKLCLELSNLDTSRFQRIYDNCGQSEQGESIRDDHEIIEHVRKLPYQIV